MIELWTDALTAVTLLAAAFFIGWIISVVLFMVARRVLRRLPWAEEVREATIRHMRGPVMLLLPAVVASIALPAIFAELPPGITATVTTLIYIMIVASIAWLIVAGASIVEAVITWRFDVEEADNLRARKVVTQTRILKRILFVAVSIVSVALILLRFEPFRELGTGLLASAGIVGIVVGIAAQNTLGNLLAGFQLAVTQPIRVDDIVIVEGDFGWVEEITLTYVVVRVWDLRRIVVPIRHFIESPFQNWTRSSSDLLGTVFLYVDYTVPVEALRAKHREIVEGSDKWDGVACVLQVTDTSERTVELRCLQSAASAPRLFELRCEVREKMVSFLQEAYPGSLPRVRAELSPSDHERPQPEELGRPHS